MKILTYNLWHGLDGIGTWFFGFVENAKQRKIRRAIQIENIRKLNPDICFFQELNPLLPGVQYFAKELSKNHIEQLDLSGIKLFGFGPPFNLQSGQAILVNSETSINKINGFQMSGSGSANNNFSSFQLSENRYALIGEIFHPEWNKILLVNVHTHHGNEFEPSWKAELLEWSKKKKWDQEKLEKILNELKSGDMRRLDEVNNLLNYLNSINGSYDLTILAGDFNCGISNQLHKILTKNGFVNSWEYKLKKPEATWDPIKNNLNHQSNLKFFEKQFKKCDFFDDEVNQWYKNVLLKQFNEPRKIDYIYLKSKKIYTSKSELFYCEKNGTFGSDHFGVILHIERE